MRTSTSATSPVWVGVTRSGRRAIRALLMKNKMMTTANDARLSTSWIRTSAVSPIWTSTRTMLRAVITDSAGNHHIFTLSVDSSTR